MVGHHFGHFEVLSTIGSGGMGVVYLARDLRLGRHVAIKVLPDGRVADERARTRFRHEAEALSRLNHPNIATIYDFDQQDGRDFLVMEYIEGQSLRDVAPGSLSPADVARLGEQLAAALVAAHGAGVVHLDLKPGNLMQTADGRLKVLDFGIARLQHADFAETTTRTGTVAIALGTPPYMAPEQVIAGPVDGRTDIYGAGATLYELATGHRLFAQPRGSSLFDAILTETPERPTRYNPAIGEALESTLLKALAKRPEERQQTAEDLRQDLHRGLEAPAPRDARPRRRWTRRDLLLIAAGSAGVLVVTGYALWAPSTGAVFHPRDFVLIGDLDNRTDDPRLPRDIKEELTIDLQQSPFIYTVSRDRVADALRRMTRPPATPIDEATGLEICRREGLAALIAGNVARSGNSTQITVKVLQAGSGAFLFAHSVSYNKPDDLFDAVRELARRVRAGVGESLADIQRTSEKLELATTSKFEALRLYTKAVEARAMGNLNEIETPLRAALQLDPDFALAHLKLGDYYMDVAGDPERAFPEIDRAYALRDRVTDRERHFIAAQYFNAHQQFEQARDSLRALAAIYPADPEFLYELAIAHYALEELAPAIAALRGSLQSNPYGARAHGSLVLFLARNNQPDAALDASRAADAAGVSAPSLLWARGLAFAGKGDLDQSRRDFEKLAEEQGYYHHLGLLQQARLPLLDGRIADAIERLRDTAALLHREGDVALEITTRVQLARALLLAVDPPSAKRELAALIQLIAPDSTRPNALRDVGSVALAAGDPRVARRCLDRLGRSVKGTITDAARSFLAGELALHDRRFDEATRQADESYGRRPYYGCLRVRAEARAALGDWTGAASSYRAMLGARGPIIQDGFTPDLRRAQDGLAHAAAMMANGKDAR